MGKLGWGSIGSVLWLFRRRRVEYRWVLALPVNPFLGDSMFAAKVTAHLCRWINLDALRDFWGRFLDKTPSLVQVARRSRKLEVVYINNKKETKCGVKIAAPPALDFLEALGGNMSLAVLLPVSSGIRMSIKREDQRTIWLAHASVFPFLGPSVRREGHPSRGPAELRLRVCLFGIGLFDVMAGKQPVGVRSLARLHCGRTAGEFLKQSYLSILVSNE